MRVVNPTTVAQVAAAGAIAVLAAFGAARAPEPTTEVLAAASTRVVAPEPAGAVTDTIDDEVEVSSTVQTRPPSTSAPTTTTVAPTTAVAPSTDDAEPTTTTAAPSTTIAAPAPSEPPAAAAVPSPTLLEATSTSRAVSDHERRGTAALARIPYDWTERLPGWTIEFHPGRSGLIGLTYTHERRIEIYVRDSLSDDLLTHVIAHELGHAVDLTLNSGADREAWQQARGISGSPWWPGNGTTDFSTGAGDFAEAFAEWQVGRGLHRSRIGGGPPTAAQYDLLAELAGG